MNDYISRPVRVQELSDAIARLALAPVVDWDNALARVGDNLELLHELVRSFLEVWPSWMTEIRIAIAEYNARHLRKTAHAPNYHFRRSIRGAMLPP
jgi:hypothetical protein